MADVRLVDRVDEAHVRALARRVTECCESFDTEAFVRDAAQDWPDTLMPRLRHVAQILGRHLPDDWWPVIAAVVGKLPEGHEGDLGFEVWPIVELLGTGHDRPSDSLDLLRELGAKTYPELGVRPYLQHDLPGTLDLIQGWVHDDRAGVRRLASEATRPRLPWAPVLRQLVADPRSTLPLLTALRDDDDHLVRNSVANHLNDISKDHPDVVVELLGEWLAEPTEHRRWIARQALRTLTKRHDARAWALLGLGPFCVDVTQFAVDDARPLIGSTTSMIATIRSLEPTPRTARIEVAIDYRRPSGRSARRVFRWWEGELVPDRPWTGRRKQSFADLSTRAHHAGDHRIELLVNGAAVADLTIDLGPPVDPMHSGRTALP